MLKSFCRQFSSSKTLHIARGAYVLQNPFNNSDEETTLSLSREDKLRQLLDRSAVGIESNELEDQWTTSPYVQGTFIQLDAEKRRDVERVKTDPEDTSIILFPGYGSQFIGMAKSLPTIPAANDLFECASELMRYDVLKMCNEGPITELNNVVNSHIAIVVASLAHMERLKEMRPNSIRDCVGTAGIGVGELTSLIFGGAFQFEQGLRLVQLRAEALVAASQMNAGGMATVFYGPDSKLVQAVVKAKEWCRENGNPNADCTIAEYLYPHYKIIAGTNDTLDYIQENKQRFRLRGIKRIKDSLPLHCHLMKPAVEPFVKALNEITIEMPSIRVYANLDSNPYMSEAHIWNNLPKQLYNPVRWEQTLHKIYARRQGNKFPTTYICGPGCANRSILKNVNMLAWKRSSHFGDISEKTIKRGNRAREQSALSSSSFKEHIHV